MTKRETIPRQRWRRWQSLALLALLAPVADLVGESSGAGVPVAEAATVIHAWIPTSQHFVAASREPFSEGEQIPVRVDGELRMAFGRGEAGGETAAKARDLLVFIDETSTLPEQKDQFLSALGARLSPPVAGRRLAFVAADRSHIEVVLPWTESPVSIARGLAELADRRVYGLELRSHMARTAAYRAQGDRGTGSTSFAAVGFSGSGRKVGAPGSRPREQIERRARRAAAQAAASVLLYPEALGLERARFSAPPVMVLVGTSWSSFDDSPSSLGSLIYAAQSRGVALFPWRGGTEPKPVFPSPGEGPGDAPVLATSTGGAVLPGRGEVWELLEAAGHGIVLDLPLPAPSQEVPLRELELLWPDALAPWLPDRWLVPSPSWQAGGRTVMAHLAKAVMPSGGLTVRLGGVEETNPGRVRVPVQLEIPLRNVALHPAGNCRVGKLEVRIAVEDPWQPQEDLPVTPVEIHRLGPRVEEEVEIWEGAVSLAPTRQRLLVSVFDPDGGGLWTRQVVFEP